MTDTLPRFDIGAEAPQYTKRCHKCDDPVRMSGPAFVQNSQWWTTCPRCRSIIQTEAKFIGEQINGYYE